MPLLPLVGLLLLQAGNSTPLSASRIHELLHGMLMSDDEKQGDAAHAELKGIFRQRGIPTIDEVGGDAAYEFVLMLCSPGPLRFQNQVLAKVREAAALGAVPADAAAYCAAHVQQEQLKAQAGKQPATEPELRDRIEQLYKSDQAVREKDAFDLEKMSGVDREHAAVLEEIFARYGVPTYAMVGQQAASDFVTMIQHQSADFRQRVLPKLKQNVAAGQADPGSYATVFDRAQTDQGRSQRYGQNLVCDSAHPQLHTGPIEDAPHVNQRRAEIGLMRLEIYTQLVIAMSPDVCSGVPPAK